MWSRHLFNVLMEQEQTRYFPLLLLFIYSQGSKHEHITVTQSHKYKHWAYAQKITNVSIIFISTFTVMRFSLVYETINSLIFHFYQSILAIWSKHMGRPMLNSIFFKMILKRHVDQLALNYSKKNNFLKDVACFDLAPWPFHLPLPWRWF